MVRAQFRTANPINNNENPLGNANPIGGPIATSTDWDPANTIQDRGALAANTVHFKFDSAVVQDNEQSNISSVAAALTSDPSVKLLIEGNCDERGTEEYNRALGERRALALREALAKAGVDPARIRTISYGKDKPADTGHDESAFAKNRRGDFVLCHPKTGGLIPVKFLTRKAARERGLLFVPPRFALLAAAGCHDLSDQILSLY